MNNTNPKITFNKEISTDKYAFMIVKVNGGKKIKMVCSGDKERILKKVKLYINKEPIKTIEVNVIKIYNKINY